MTSRRDGETYVAEMHQGIAASAEPMARDRIDDLLATVNVQRADLAANLPMQVLSTGLPYLIVPVSANLERARIVVAGFEALLATVGAKFVRARRRAARGPHLGHRRPRRRHRDRQRGRASCRLSRCARACPA